MRESIQLANKFVRQKMNDNLKGKASKELLCQQRTTLHEKWQEWYAQMSCSIRGISVAALKVEIVNKSVKYSPVSAL